MTSITEPKFTILLVGNGQSRTDVKVIPRVGETIKLHSAGKIMIEGVVEEVEHFYSPTFDEITVKVK